MKVSDPNIRRVQLKHVQIDHNFFQKPKIMALVYRYKADGAALFIDILCMMARATDSEIDIDCIRAEAARLLSWDEARADEYIKYIIDRDLIHVGSKPFLVANRRVIEDQESMAAKQEKWRDNKRTKRGQKEENAGRVNIEDLNTEQLNNEELKTEESKKETANLPESLSTEEHKDALRRWAKYTKRLGKPLDQLQMETLALNWAGRPRELILGINQSIERGYRKIIYEPINEKPPNVNQKMQNGAVSIADSDHPAAIAERRRKENERRQNV